MFYPPLSLSSKIMLNKMCELLDAENKDIKFFIIGPGWVKTKIHEKIMNNLSENDLRYIETKNFMENKHGTSMDEIFEFVRWLEEQEKNVVSGRNFSINDNWKDDELINKLKSDKNMYKLRRQTF